MPTAVSVHTIHLGHLPNTALDQTSTRLVPVFNGITLPLLLPAVQAFAAKSAAYSAAVKRQLISVLTEEIQALERNRDHALTELFRDVANELQSTTPAIREAAHRVDTALRNYGNPSRLPMDMQTNVINDIIAALISPDVVPYTEKLIVAKAVTFRLSALNNDFARLFNERVAEHDHREKGIVQRTRRELEPALRRAIDKINAWQLLNEDSAELADTVASANSILEESQHLINRRAGQRHRAGDGGEGGEAAGEEVNN